MRWRSPEVAHSLALCSHPGRRTLPAKLQIWAVPAGPHGRSGESASRQLATPVQNGGKLRSPCLETGRLCSLAGPPVCVGDPCRGAQACTQLLLHAGDAELQMQGCRRLDCSRQVARPRAHSAPTRGRERRCRAAPANPAKVRHIVAPSRSTRTPVLASACSVGQSCH